MCWITQSNLDCCCDTLQSTAGSTNSPFLSYKLTAILVASQFLKSTETDYGNLKEWYSVRHKYLLPRQVKGLFKKLQVDFQSVNLDELRKPFFRQVRQF